MSFAALFWAMAAMMQVCMLSQFGQKQLQYHWLTQRKRKVLFWTTILFFSISLISNCWYEGNSVGAITWLFAILTSAFFLQFMCFYSLRQYFAWIWLGAVLAALISTMIERGA